MSLKWNNENKNENKNESKNENKNESKNENELTSNSRSLYYKNKKE